MVPATQRRLPRVSTVDRAWAHWAGRTVADALTPWLCRGPAAEMCWSRFKHKLSGRRTDSGDSDLGRF